MVICCLVILALASTYMVVKHNKDNKMAVNVPYLRYLDNLRSGGMAATAPSPAKGLRSLVSKPDLAAYEPTSTEKTDAAVAEISKAGAVAGAALGKAVAPKKESSPLTERSTTSSITVVGDDGEEVTATPEQISTGDPDATTLVPRPATDYSKDPFLKNFSKKINTLKNDESFTSELNSLKEAYPELTERDLFYVIAKESSMDPTIVNDSGYKGLFQMGKDAAADAGIDYSNLEDKTPAEQLKEYRKYMEYHNFDASKHTLGLLQAAPSYLNASPDTVVYSKLDNPSIYKLNKGWFKDDDATVQSINSFYKGQS